VYNSTRTRKETMIRVALCFKTSQQTRGKAAMKNSGP